MLVAWWVSLPTTHEQLAVNCAVSLCVFLSWQNQTLDSSVERFDNLNAKDWVTHCLGPSQGTVM